MRASFRDLTTSVAAGALLVACGGGSSSPAPAPVAPLPPPPPPVVTVITETVSLTKGDDLCFQGGEAVRTGGDANGDGILQDGEVESVEPDCAATMLDDTRNFARIATFPVCRQIEPDCDDDDDTRAETLAVSEDGLTLLYTDTAEEVVGLVDITAPEAPVPAGRIEVADDPRGIGVRGGFALVAVDTSDGDGTSSGTRTGQLEVIDIDRRRIVRTIALPGQPDGLDISPDGQWAAIAIENEFVASDADPDVDAGAPGELVVLAIASDDPAEWTSRRVALTGLADIAPGDPEPESVAIGPGNIVAVTLQENNHIALVDLDTAEVVGDFTAGSTTVTDVDADVEIPAQVAFDDDLPARRRQPDGVAWISAGTLVTADEGVDGDEGGTRGLTVFGADGRILASLTGEVDRTLAEAGHYPALNIRVFGNEPESVATAVFGAERFTFLASERGNAVLVYNSADPAAPAFKQVLPTGVQPEGVLAIPDRDLLVAASEEDDRDAGARASISIYRYAAQSAAYPELALPGPVTDAPVQVLGALSGLGADPDDASVLHAVHDDAIADSAVLTFRTDGAVSVVDRATVLSDPDDVFASTPVETTEDDRERFDAADRDRIADADGTLDLDLEGVAARPGGGFWVVSEGAGDFDTTFLRPIASRNFLIRTDGGGRVEEVVRLPSEVDGIQKRRGFAGVAVDGERVVVPFQAQWGIEDEPRIGIWNTRTRSWSFVFYPLDAPEGPAGGRVFVQDIAPLGGGRFLVLEADDRPAPDAAVKRIYEIDITGAAERSTLSKTLRRDLVADGDLPVDGGFVPAKPSGLAVATDGQAYVVNDNDLLVQATGEQRLLRLGDIAR